MKRILLFLGVLMAGSIAAAETLSFANLKPNEKIVIVYRSQGCFHHVETMYQAESGKKFRLGIVENPTARKTGRSADGDREAVGTTELTSDDRFGLDCYLLFLRRGFKGGCTTTDQLVVGYYRDGLKIGEERFVDSTCAIRGEILPDGRIVQKDTYGGDFPKEVFQAIVPPWMIVTRMKKEANQTPEPTAPSGRGSS
jgi:hypothetical protein